MSTTDGLALAARAPMSALMAEYSPWKATALPDVKAPGWPVMLIWLAILIGLPAMVAWQAKPRAPVAHAIAPAPGFSLGVRPASPPPPVEPMEVLAIDRDQARVLNSGIPFSTLPNPAARPFRFVGSESDLARATDCLAAAQYYEAGDDSVGQEAVAQVVLNRLRHPAFPKTVCGVVFQGSERRTGCQFTFTCDGALARTPSPAAWERARALAKAALAGAVFPKVGYSTHYHTDWVVPYWSGTLDKVAAVGTHLFFRWTGWWGTPPAFHRTVSIGEPTIPGIARLSPAHQAGVSGTALPGLALVPSATEMAAAPAAGIGTDALGKTRNGTRLIAIESKLNAFVVALDRSASPDSYPGIAASFCSGLPRCRILAWTNAALAPKAFPIDPEDLGSMSFSYIHDSAMGLQRALWNCAEIKRANAAECMRQREPVAAEAAKPPRAVETVVIRQP